RLQDAGPAQLEERAVAMAGNQTVEREFAGRVETAVTLGDLLAEKAIGGDDLRLAKAALAAVVEHQHVVAEAIERIAVAPGDQRAHIGDRRHLLVKHSIAQLLGAFDFLSRAGEAHLRVAQPAEGAGSPVEAPPISPHPFGKTLWHQG